MVRLDLGMDTTRSLVKTVPGATGNRAGEASFQRHFADLIAVQIHEPDAPPAKFRFPIRPRREQAPYPAGAGPSPTRTVFAPRARKALAALPPGEGSCSLQPLGCTPPGSLQQYGLAAKVQIEQTEPFDQRASSGRRRNLHEESRRGTDVCGGR